MQLLKENGVGGNITCVMSGHREEPGSRAKCSGSTASVVVAPAAAATAATAATFLPPPLPLWQEEEKEPATEAALHVALRLASSTTFECLGFPPPKSIGGPKGLGP